MVFLLMIALLVPTLASALFLFWVDPFDPAQIHSPELTRVKAPVIVPKVSGWILQESELVGSDQVLGPEDMVYEPSSQVLYTGCADGWVKRVKLGESALDIVVEDWVNTGGRPLGLAIAGHGADVIVGDAHKVSVLIVLNHGNSYLTFNMKISIVMHEIAFEFLLVINIHIK